jgi:hypothetical protein
LKFNSFEPPRRKFAFVQLRGGAISAGTILYELRTAVIALNSAERYYTAFTLVLASAVMRIAVLGPGFATCSFASSPQSKRGQKFFMQPNEVVFGIFDVQHPEPSTSFLKRHGERFHLAAPGLGH